MKNHFEVWTLSVYRKLCAAFSLQIQTENEQIIGIGATRILHTIAPTVVVVVVVAIVDAQLVSRNKINLFSTNLRTRTLNIALSDLRHSAAESLSLAPSFLLFFVYSQIHVDVFGRFFKCGFTRSALNLIPTPLRFWWFLGLIERDGGRETERSTNSMQLICSCVRSLFWSVESGIIKFC